jgi:hypothetical protein
MAKRTLLVVGWTMAILGAACGNAGNESAIGTTSPPAPTTTSPPSPTGLPTPQPSSSPQLEDGKNFGFIKSVQLTAQPQFIVFDLAYFLTGDAANQASEAHGGENPVPNDYYIVNDNPRLRVLAVSPGLNIQLLDWGHCCDAFFRADYQLFQDSFTHTKYPTGNYKGTNSPYWLTVRNGVVVKIEEQYLP